MRRGGELLEAFGGERRDLGERLARDELRRELAGDRGGELDGFGLEPLLDRGEPARQAVERVADLLEGDRGAALGDGGALLLGGGEAVAEALALGLGELERVLGRRRPAAPPGWRPAAKSLVEQEFGLAPRHASSVDQLFVARTWR